MEHPESRHHFSCQPGPHAVQVMAVSALAERRGTHASFISVAVIRSCKFPRFLPYTDRIMLQKDGRWTVWHSSDSRWWTVNSRGRIVRETRSRRISWVHLVVLSLHVICLPSLCSKIPVLSVFVQSATGFCLLMKKAKCSAWLLKIAGSGLNWSRLIEFS